MGTTPEFARLAREHEPALHAVALRLTGNPSDARDLVQDTYERAIQRFAQFTAGTNARAWLVTILHHLFIDRCRQKRPETQATPIDDVDVAATVPEAPPVWASITAEQLRAALGQLDADFRAVYELKEVERLSYQEISARLGIPTATVGTRILRARKRLRELLLPLVEGGAT